MADCLDIGSDDGEQAEGATTGEWREHYVGTLINDEVIAIGDGYRAKNSELSEAGLPFARAGNISNGFQFSDADCFPEDQLHKVGEKTSRPGDTVFTSKGTVGRFAFVREDTPQFVYSPQLSFWRSLNESVLDPRFVYYWMSSEDFYFQFKSVAGQTDMAEYVSLRDQRQMHITLPPIREQRAIAHILGTLDDKIELNRRMNQTLEAMARALFKSWFVDFDPVRAKAALKQHSLENHAGSDAETRGNGAAPAGEWTVKRARAYLDAMDPKIVDLFPDRMVPSDPGEIPEGWEVKTLGELSDLNSESWSRTDSPKEVEYVDLANTKWGVIETIQHFPWKDAPSRAKRILRSGDTIVGTVRPSNGSYSLVGRDGLTGSTGFAVLRPSNDCFRELIYLVATSPENIEQLAHRADGAAYPAVRPEVIAETEVPIPISDTDLLGRFSMAVGSIIDKIESIKAEMCFLADQRDALLPKLVSGESKIVELH